MVKLIFLESPSDFCTISAHDDTRIFKVDSTGILRVSNLRLNHGRGDKGGAIFIHGQFLGDNVMFADNVASIIGGAGICFGQWCI